VVFRPSFDSARSIRPAADLPSYAVGAVRLQRPADEGCWRHGCRVRTGGRANCLPVLTLKSGSRQTSLWLVRSVVNEVLAALYRDFSGARADGGRPSITPERLPRALLLQAFDTIRSERQLMEQFDYNLLCRWFAGLGVDEPE
jgi:Transposase domain (DUF772)